LALLATLLAVLVLARKPTSTEEWQEAFSNAAGDERALALHALVQHGARPLHEAATLEALLLSGDPRFVEYLMTFDVTRITGKTRQRQFLRGLEDPQRVRSLEFFLRYRRRELTRARLSAYFPAGR